jgi:aryl-alcohol dehydrogenase-like predicted oxidoreductase
MNMRKLGHSDIEASVIGLGTWAMGGWMWGGTDEQASIKAIQVSLDSGVNLIDTAPAYGLGKAEELVGKAIRGRREKVVLATKCGLVWHTKQGNHFFNEADKPVHRFLGGKSIRYELEESLRRLQTDYVDLYFTHWQDPTTPIPETMATLLELKKEGKIRAIGVSNVNLDELKAYLKVGVVDCIQEQYNMLHRDIEVSLLPTCIANGVSTLSYSSLALGLLSGKIGPERTFQGDDLRKNDPRFSQENRLKMVPFFEGMAAIALRYKLSIAQLVIAWTVAQKGITYALCGARNTEQALENAKAGDAVLKAEDVKMIDGLMAKHLC